MSSPKRVTIDMTVIHDYLRPGRERHALAVELFELARAGKVNIAIAPQGHRFDASEPLAAEVRALFETDGIDEARQLAYVSDQTFPSDDLYPGQYIEGFSEAWANVLATWGSGPGHKPGDADRFHAETHMLERRAVFVTDDAGLRVACRRLREDHGFAIEAMTLSDYLSQRSA